MNRIQKLAMIFVAFASLFASSPALAFGINDVLPGEICQALGTCDDVKDPRIIAASLIRSAMGLLGIIAIVIVLGGGFIWMTAGGSEEKVATAKKWLYSGVIGLIIILSAYAITSFVLSGLLSATNGGSQQINNI